MKTIQIEIPEGKRAEWVDGVLTLVDEQPVEFKFKVGDKVTISPCGFIGLIKGRYNESGVAAYKVYSELEGDFEAPETSLEPYTEPQDITERIKTFEDAKLWCTENGYFNFVREYDCIVTDTLILDEASKDLIAYLKLRIITCALNEGWEPTFMDGERRWSPTWKIVSGEVEDCFAQYNELLHSNRPPILTFKSRQLAQYAALQFKDIYMDFCYKGKE